MNILKVSHQSHCVTLKSKTQAMGHVGNIVVPASVFDLESGESNKASVFTQEQEGKDSSALFGRSFEYVI